MSRIESERRKKVYTFCCDVLYRFLEAIGIGIRNDDAWRQHIPVSNVVTMAYRRIIEQRHNKGRCEVSRLQEWCGHESEPHGRQIGQHPHRAPPAPQPLQRHHSGAVVHRAQHESAVRRQNRSTEAINRSEQQTRGHSFPFRTTCFAFARRGECWCT